MDKWGGLCDPITMPSDLPVQSLVDAYLYRDSKVAGCISSKQIGSLPRIEWDRKSVADVMTPCSPGNSFQAESEAVKALAQMNRTGMLVLKDLMKLVAFRMELEERAEAA